MDKDGNLQKEVKNEGVPGPGTYYFVGDFDFKDPSKVEDKDKPEPGP